MGMNPTLFSFDDNLVTIPSNKFLTDQVLSAFQTGGIRMPDDGPPDPHGSDPVPVS